MSTAAAEAATTTDTTTTATGAETKAPADVSGTTEAAVAAAAATQAAATTETKDSTETKPVEYKLTLPDNAALDAAGLDRTIAFARASGLSPEVAQKAAAFADAEVKTARDAFLAAYQPGDPEKNVAPGAEWKKMHDGYLAAALADPGIGNGDQATLDVKVAKAQQAFEKFASPELRTLLARTGYGSHPEVVRAFAAIGEAMGEKPPISSNGEAPGRLSDAEVFFAKKD